MRQGGQGDIRCLDSSKCHHKLTGLRFVFPERPFTLGFAFSADLGVHMQRVAGQNSNILRLYRGGLRRVWLPEIHLSYRF